MFNVLGSWLKLFTFVRHWPGLTMLTQLHWNWVIILFFSDSVSTLWSSTLGGAQWPRRVVTAPGPAHSACTGHVPWATVHCTPARPDTNYMRRRSRGVSNISNIGYRNFTTILYYFINVVSFWKVRFVYISVLSFEKPANIFQSNSELNTIHSLPTATQISLRITPLSRLQCTVKSTVCTSVQRPPCPAHLSCTTLIRARGNIIVVHPHYSLDMYFWNLFKRSGQTKVLFGTMLLEIFARVSNPKTGGWEASAVSGRMLRIFHVSFPTMSYHGPRSI